MAETSPSSDQVKSVATPPAPAAPAPAATAPGKADHTEDPSGRSKDVRVESGKAEASEGEEDPEEVDSDDESDIQPVSKFPEELRYSNPPDEMTHFLIVHSVETDARKVRAYGYSAKKIGRSEKEVVGRATYEFDFKSKVWRKLGIPRLLGREARKHWARNAIAGVIALAGTFGGERIGERRGHPSTGTSQEPPAAVAPATPGGAATSEGEGAGEAKKIDISELKSALEKKLLGAKLTTSNRRIQETLDDLQKAKTLDAVSTAEQGALGILAAAQGISAPDKLLFDGQIRGFAGQKRAEVTPKK